MSLRARDRRARSGAAQFVARAPRGAARDVLGRTGFTLLELMVSLLIIGVVMGAGIGAITSFDPSASAARGLVTNALRQARNEAIAYGAPSRVTFDPVEGTVRSIGFVVAGTWRFEGGSTAGLGGLDATVEDDGDGLATEDGFIGDGIDLSLGGVRARVEIDVTPDPRLRLRRGFRVGLAARAALGGAAGTLLDFGGALTVEVGATGALDVRMATASVDEFGRARKGESVRLLTPAGAVPGGRWVQVEVLYDRETFAVLVNGVTLAERAETRAVWGLEGPLTVGGGRSSFKGTVDDLVVAVVRVDEAVSLPGGALLVGSEPFDVHFDSSGQLDPVHHGGPAEVSLSFADGRESTIRVMPAGTVL